MKLVITTQIRENYGAHDWDGQGQCPQHWKCKGGDVYVVADLTPAQILKIKSTGIPTLTTLIQSRNEAFEEIVVDWGIYDDSEPVCADWDTPIFLSYVGGSWHAKHVTENGEYGYMRQEIASKTQEYDLLPNGERQNYVCCYTMKDGAVIAPSDMESHLTMMAAAA